MNTADENIVAVKQFSVLTWMSTGNFITVSDKAASSISNGRPLKRSSNLNSHLSKAEGVICDALGPSTNSSVLLHHTAYTEEVRNGEYIDEILLISKILHLEFGCTNFQVKLYTKDTP